MISITRPAVSTGRVKINMSAVKTIPQVLKTMLPKAKPLALIWKIVVKKLRDDKKLEIPARASPRTITSIDTGERDIREVDNGGYSVQPEPPPNSAVVDNSTHPKEIGNRSNETELIRGKATSGAPL